MHYEGQMKRLIKESDSINQFIKCQGYNFSYFSQVGVHYLHNVLQQVVQRKSLHLSPKKNQKYSMPGKRDT